MKALPHTSSDCGTTGGIECENNECRLPTPTSIENSQCAYLCNEERSGYEPSVPVANATTLSGGCA